jgi:hypothetical protein
MHDTFLIGHDLFTKNSDSLLIKISKKPLINFFTNINQYVAF